MRCDEHIVRGNLGKTVDYTAKISVSLAGKGLAQRQQNIVNTFRLQESMVPAQQHSSQAN